MSYPYSLRPLPYALNALAPEIGEDTLFFHHDRHLKTYVENLNLALEGCPACQSKSLEELLCTLNSIPEEARTPIRNNGGGVYNHELYFSGMSPQRDQHPSGALAGAIDQAFGSYEAWKRLMKESALGQFGSGYAFLVCDRSGAVSVMKTANQDSPLTLGFYPILCCDVWEHAYYLNYQNLRASYVDAWFRVVNWDYAGKRYDANR